MTIEPTTKATYTFLDLLEKYDGNIKLASSAELKQVQPTGLRAYFSAKREYAAQLKTKEALAETNASIAEPNLTS